MVQRLAVLSLVAGAVLAATPALKVRVVDSQGAAIAGATVEARCRSGSSTRTTDLEGAATLTCDSTPAIRVSAPGFEAFLQEFAESAGSEMRIELKPAILQTTVDVVVRQSMAEGPVTGSAVEMDRLGARTVMDAIDRLAPGAFVTRRGVMGYGIATNGTGGVAIRGIGGQPTTGVLMVIDGRPDAQGLMGHPLPDFYSLSDAASVSVTQGPASVLYGSNAMGGVIEVRPHRPERGFETTLTSTAGSFFTGQHRLAHGGAFARSFYHLTAGVSHTGGDRPGSAFRNQDASVASGYDLASHWKTSLQGRYGFFHVEDPGPVQAPLNGAYARVGRGGFSWNLDNAYRRTFGYARVYGGYGRHFITDGFRSVDETTGVRLQQTVLAGSGFSADIGTDITRFGGRAQNVRGRIDYGEHELSEGAAFGRLNWAARDGTRLAAGLRYHRHSLYGAIGVPEFSLARRLGERLSISAAVAKGFRNPTIRELYLFPAPNPLLKPEHVWNYQATLQARPFETLTAWTTFYYADLKNLIVTEGRFPNLRLTNAGAALNRGIEGNGRWRPRRKLAFNSGYAWLRSTNLAPYLPAHKLNYSLDVDLGRAILNVGGMTAGRRWADAAHSRQLGEYSVLTMRLTAPVGRRLSLLVLIDNALGRRYEVLPGYPMPGVNAMGGFTLRFR